MKIINLYAENLKRLTAVEISPDGNLVQITGRNGQGKTSVLDAIWWALDGASNVQATPIRQGEERALIRLDLGEVKVTRRFNAQEDGTYTTSITVENADGARYSSPQQMLDKMLGELTFDPLAFTRMKPADQVLAMRSLVPDFDFDQNEAQIKEAFNERTESNRKAKEAQAASEAIAKNLPEEIPEKVDAGHLMKQWQEATAANQMIEQRKAKRQTFKDARDSLAVQIEAMQAQLAEKDAEIASWEPLPEMVDADALQAKLSTANETNQIADAAQLHRQHVDDAKVASANSEQLTLRITEMKAAAQKAIASAEMPIEGLGIDDGVVTLDGVPFDQASDAQQLQASIAIAMALNPRLKVIRVRDGSLLDEYAMKVLAHMADSRDYQIWIERVDSSGSVGFVLEDGHVKGQDLKEATEDKEKQRPKEKPAPSMFHADQQ